ncbi:TPA: glycoside hydrolase family protein [Vibrio parahaemolyticus]
MMFFKKLGLAIALVSAIGTTACASNSDYDSRWGNDLYERIQEAPVGGGFSMDGYWVWGSSVVKGDDGKYHMFVSRWRQELLFHPGWMVESEIVHAVSDTPEGPYEFSDLALDRRGAQYWDGQSVHNPRVIKHNGKYIMFYMGSTHNFPDLDDPKKLKLGDEYTIIGRANKRIGIAVSDSPYGPWERRDEPALDTKPDTYYSFLTSNPSPWINEDGSVDLIFKSRFYNEKFPYHSKMNIGLARAKSIDDPFEVVSKESIFSEKRFGVIEDPFIWRDETGYHLIAKDHYGALIEEAKAGIMAHSKDGLNWFVDKEHPQAYSKTVKWDNGKNIAMGQLERPFILMDDNGKPSHIFFATMDGIGGFENASKSWNMVVPLKK